MAGSNGHSPSNFWRNLHTVFHGGCTNLLFYQQCRGSLFSTSSLPFVISCHFNDSHSNRGTFPDVSDGKESACNAGDLGLIFGLGRPPGEGNGYPLQCSFLENSRTEESGMLQSLGLQRVRHN